jgi:hypothetical protein
MVDLSIPSRHRHNAQLLRNYPTHSFTRLRRAGCHDPEPGVADSSTVKEQRRTIELDYSPLALMLV